MDGQLVAAVFMEMAMVEQMVVMEDLYLVFFLFLAQGFLGSLVDQAEQMDLVLLPIRMQVLGVAAAAALALGAAAAAAVILVAVAVSMLMLLEKKAAEAAVHIMKEPIKLIRPVII